MSKIQNPHANCNNYLRYENIVHRVLTNAYEESLLHYLMFLNLNVK